jgi:hypothetical protein
VVRAEGADSSIGTGCRKRKYTVTGVVVCPFSENIITETKARK